MSRPVHIPKAILEEWEASENFNRKRDRRRISDNTESERPQTPQETEDKQEDKGKEEEEGKNKGRNYNKLKKYKGLKLPKKFSLNQEQKMNI